ncbi:MAG: hypothetical protein J6L76_01875, partial [Clostridia bacterium]|nr:hypothetical protein [Clostridia bacterium]
ADGIQQESNILDYYVSGESFPLGRMAYVYETKGGVVPGGSTAVPSTEAPSAPQKPGTTQAPNATKQPGDEQPTEGEQNVPIESDNTVVVAVIIIAAALCIGIGAFVVIILVNKKKSKV